MRLDNHTPFDSYGATKPSLSISDLRESTRVNETWPVNAGADGPNLIDIVNRCFRRR